MLPIPEFFEKYLQSLSETDKLAVYRWLTQDTSDISRVIEMLDTIDPADNPLIIPKA